MTGKLNTDIPLHLQSNNQYSSRKISNKHVFVSYYYPVLDGKQRHPLSVYQNNAQRFFKIIKLPTIVYTQRKYLKILNITHIPKNFVINEKYDSPYGVCNMIRYKEKYIKIAKRMKKTEHYIIRDIFAAIWNLKVCLLKEVLDNSDYNIIHWLDIGIFKNDDYIGHSLHDTSRIDRVYQRIGDKIFFGSLYPIRNFEIQPIWHYTIKRHEFFTGGYFCGSRNAIINFHNEFFKIHDFFVKRLQYVCREEYLYSTYCIYNPKNCSFIHMYGNKCYAWTSAVGFIFASNPCNHSSSVNYFDYLYKDGKRYIYEYSMPL